MTAGSSTYAGRGGAPVARRKRILVAISGGGNSAVVAALFKSQGHEVLGVYFQLDDPKAPLTPAFPSRCMLTKKLESAQEVCRKLDIPLHVLKLEDRFEGLVVDPFVHEVLKCRLPNPCLPCNREIRFEALFRKADELGCESVATGHHAQIFHETLTTAKSAASTSLARLQRAINADKDQSYFLYGLDQPQLLRLMMPLGGFQDVMIERLAREFQLPESAGAGQQEACFNRPGSYISFIEARSPSSLRPGGQVKTWEGTVVGDHRGLHHYQLGQKHGLKLTLRDADQLVVTGLDLAGHSLIVGPPSMLNHSEIRASHTHWVRPVNGLKGVRCQARVRPQQKVATACHLTLFENGATLVQFEAPQAGIVPGQAVVFYDGEEVLGGAVIDLVGGIPVETIKKREEKPTK